MRLMYAGPVQSGPVPALPPGVEDATNRWCYEARSDAQGFDSMGVPRIVGNAVQGTENGGIPHIGSIAETVRATYAMAAKRLPESGPVVLDIEYLPFALSDAQPPMRALYHDWWQQHSSMLGRFDPISKGAVWADRCLSYLEAALGAVRAARPGVQVGFYGLLPTDEWSDRLLRQCDFTAPALYPTRMGVTSRGNPNAGTEDWAVFAAACSDAMRKCGQFGKPIMPVVSPVYYNSRIESGTPLSELDAATIKHAVADCDAWLWLESNTTTREAAGRALAGLCAGIGIDESAGVTEA